MSEWSTLICLSALAGGICGLIFGGRNAIILGGAVPWTGLLAWLLYNEYFVPYQGGGGIDVAHRPTLRRLGGGRRGCGCGGGRLWNQGEIVGRRAAMKSRERHDNGMHAARDTSDFMLRVRCGRARDARR